MKNPTKLGMILTECLTSIAILTVCIVVLSGVITSSASSTAMSKDYVIAQNLANEATNVVKIIRNSNWMIRPEKKADCWLVKDPNIIIVPTNPCTNNTVLAGPSDFYIPVFTPLTGAWSLLKATTSDDLDLTNSLINSTNSKYILKLTGPGIGTKMYIQNSATGTDTTFYRRIKFTSITDELANFEVKVEWKDGAKVRKFLLTDSITNSL